MRLGSSWNTSQSPQWGPVGCEQIITVVDRWLLMSCQPRTKKRLLKRVQKALKEVPVGFEPTNGGFAIHCVSHFATAPGVFSLWKTVYQLVRKATHVVGAENPD